jgi:ribonuclease BN (tRNA processing enzyme)
VRLIVIGCSGSFPGPDSPASSYLLEHQGFRLLLDLGNGALGPLQRHTALSGVGAICLSHLHADHCLDLCGYWVAQTYAPDGPGPRIPVYGPAGTARRMAQVYGLDEHPGMTQAFDFGTLEPGTQEIGPFRLTLARMNHPVETFGFRVEAGGRAIAYSADTGESAALVDLARAADVLLCEASFLDEPGLPEGVHLTARQAAEHAARAGAGQLILTHLVPWNDRQETLQEATPWFPGRVSLATSGLVIDLG